MDIKYKKEYVPRIGVARSMERVYCDPLGTHVSKSRFRRYKDLVKPRRSHRSVLSHAHTGTRTSVFYTSDSHLYQTRSQEFDAARGRTYLDRRKYFDAVHARHTDTFSTSQKMHAAIASQFSTTRARLFGFRAMFRWNLSPIRMWQFSMTSAMLFGMVTMAMIYQNLGQVAHAAHDGRALTMDPTTAMIVEGGTDALAFEVPLERDISTGVLPGQLPLEDDLPEPIDPVQEAFEANTRELVAGHPIEAMLPEIFRFDRDTASYLIAIAKIESNWGKRKPVLDGEDCLNYWGYRAQRDRMGSGGHTCFDSAADAVQTVGKRIHALVHDFERKAPRQMLVWKCGSTCEGHSPEGVERWVNVVTQYRNALFEERAK